MKRRDALKLAVKILQAKYNYLLFASDSQASEQWRVEIARAIETLDAMRRQKEMKL